MRNKDNQPFHLVCNCCGKSLKNTEKENADFNTGRRDYGFGTCMDCLDWQTNR